MKIEFPNGGELLKETNRTDWIARNRPLFHTFYLAPFYISGCTISTVKPAAYFEGKGHLGNVWVRRHKEEVLPSLFAWYWKLCHSSANSCFVYTVRTGKRTLPEAPASFSDSSAEQDVGDDFCVEWGVKREISCPNRYHVGATDVTVCSNESLWLTCLL